MMVRIWVMAILMAAELASAETNARQVWPIGREEVASLLSKAGNLKLELGSFELPGEPVTNQPHPELQVESWRRNPPLAAIEFRLRCAQRRQCGDFLVRVRPGTAELERFEGVGWRRQRADHTRSTAVLLARQGRPAKMAWKGDGFKLWVPVMCLQTGGLGDRIRVRDRSGRKVFLAMVTGPAELEAVTE